MPTIKTRKRKTEVDLEKQILIHSIISTQFLKEVNIALKPSHFQIPFAKIVYKWILDYFKKYNEAPGKYIEDIYKLECETLGEAESKLVEGFLEDISKKYEEDGKLNVSLYKDEAKKYVKKRNLLELCEKTKSNLELDRIDDAENLVVKYNKIAENTTRWVNPNNLDFAKEVFASGDEDELIHFPGALGTLIGPLSRGFFCTSLGVSKIGKSFFLHEIRHLGLLNGLNVVEINLEMSDKQLAKRYYQRISAFGNEGGKYIYPSFDCLANQLGTCKKSCRKNKIPAVDEDGMRLNYDDPRVKNYKICTECRGDKYGDFELSTWMEEAETKELTYDNIKGSLKAQTRMYGDNYRLITYPKFSASVKNLENDLDLLEATEGFKADVLILDYADALKKPPGFEGVDEVWRELARMGSERGVLLVTTSHVAERRTEGKRSISSFDASGNTSKSRHVDIMIGHSQSPEEKRMGIIRCSVLEHRHKYFNELDEVYVTRALNQGQSLLDSEFVPDKKQLFKD